MALIQCPECGKRVSSFAKSCPECGYPIAKQNNENVNIKPKNNSEIAQNDTAENKNDCQPDNEQIFLESDIKQGNSTPLNDEKKQKQTKKRKVWLVQILLVCLVLAGAITYSVMLKDAEGKKAEARQFYSQKEYQKLSWKLNEIPAYFIDAECETLEYAGSIGFGYSSFMFYLDYKAGYNSEEDALGALISSVWIASKNTWYASKQSDLSLTSDMLDVQRVIIQDYYTILEDYYGLSKQQIDAAVAIGNSATNETRGSAMDEYVSTLYKGNPNKTSQEPVNDSFAQYISDNSITLDNYDVQYNMANNLDKEFSLVGYAELDDYYNYGFDDKLESSYFCLQVTPENGKYSDAWYIYCYRNSYQNLFDKTQAAGKKYVKMICCIPKGRFEEGQNNMATLRYVVY